MGSKWCPPHIVDEIVARLSRHESQRSIARAMGVTRSVVVSAKNRKYRERVKLRAQNKITAQVYIWGKTKRPGGYGGYEAVFNRDVAFKLFLHSERLRFIPRLPDGAGDYIEEDSERGRRYREIIETRIKMAGQLMAACGVVPMRVDTG